MYMPSAMAETEPTQVIGISLFGEIVPQHFGTLPGTALTLFVLLTQDGWVGIFNDIRAADESQYDGMSIARVWACRYSK